MDRYCVACHSDRGFERGTVPISLQGVDMTDVGVHADILERVVRKVRGELMPPPRVRRPDDAVRVSMVTWLETEFDRAATDRPPVGRPITENRLNRAEYRNPVRDLPGIDVDIAELLAAGRRRRGGL